MNKIKLFSIVFLSLAVANVSNAQIDDIKPNDVAQLHNRTLIVIVEETTDMVTEKLNTKKKADKQATYKSAVDVFNKNFADAVTQYWKLTTGGDVEFKKLDDVNDITDKKNYAVLFCRSATISDLSNAYQTNNNGLLWWPDFKEVAHDKDFMGKVTVMGIALLEKMNKTPFYQFPIPDLFPSRTDLEYAVNVMNNYLNYKLNNKKASDEDMLKENQTVLRDKTLLLRRDLMDKRLTKEEMDKDYPYPYMVVGKDTIERAIDSASDKYAAAMVTPYDLSPAPNGGVQYVEYAYNIEDGAILATSGIPDMPSNPKASNTPSANAAKPVITKKVLLDFCMYLGEDSDDSGKGGKKKGGHK